MVFTSNSQLTKNFGFSYHSASCQKATLQDLHLTKLLFGSYFFNFTDGAVVLHTGQMLFSHFVCAANSTNDVTPAVAKIALKDSLLVIFLAFRATFKTFATMTRLWIWFFYIRFMSPHIKVLCSQRYRRIFVKHCCKHNFVVARHGCQSSHLSF